MPKRNSSTPKNPARKHMENMAKAAFPHSSRKTGSLSGTSTRPSRAVPPRSCTPFTRLSLGLAGRHREAPGGLLEGMRHAQHGGVVEVLADDHHPDRQPVGQP